MPRRNKVDERRKPQHHKKRKRPRSWHRNIDSPGMRDAAKWLQGGSVKRLICLCLRRHDPWLGRCFRCGKKTS